LQNYIEENLANSITLQELASLACVCTRHFERAFRVGTPDRHRFAFALQMH